MFNDIYIHCPDTAALVAALRDIWPHRLDETDPDNPAFLLDKSPTVRAGAETLALVRVRDDQPEVREGLESLEELGVITILGTWDDVQANPAKITIYDRVYPRLPVVWADEDGNEHEYTPPAEIGRFA
ncbi:MAG: hypothetical protein OEZ59_14125 [Deltaproteobacteria bacterium]|nr:hypothetical protein [Deltaproteobacteria bacterium]